MNQKKLKKTDFISIFLRTFLLQAVWNFKSLVSVGISFALVPVARRLSETQEGCISILKRHLFFFNAHPFFASYALGALARLEEDHVNGVIKDPEQIEKFRNAIIGPLGAVGDIYFWSTIKPAAIIVGVSGALLSDSLGVQLFFIALMLLLYNIPHLQIRISGIWKGYTAGYNVYKSIKIERFTKVRTIYLLLGAGVMGVIISGMFIKTGFNDYKSAIVFVSAAVGTGIFHFFKIPMQFSVLIVIVFAILIGML